MIQPLPSRCLLPAHRCKFPLRASTDDLIRAHKGSTECREVPRGQEIQRSAQNAVELFRESFLEIVSRFYKN